MFQTKWKVKGDDKVEVVAGFQTGVEAAEFEKKLKDAAKLLKVEFEVEPTSGLGLSTGHIDRKEEEKAEVEKGDDADNGGVKSTDETPVGSTSESETVSESIEAPVEKEEKDEPQAEKRGWFR